MELVKIRKTRRNQIYQCAMTADSESKRREQRILSLSPCRQTTITKRRPKRRRHFPPRRPELEPEYKRRVCDGSLNYKRSKFHTASFASKASESTNLDFSQLEGAKAVRIVGERRHHKVLLLGDHRIFRRAVLRADPGTQTTVRMRQDICRWE